MKIAYYIGIFAARAPTHRRIRKYVQKVDTIIHIFQNIEPVCGYRILATNMMRHDEQSMSIM